MFNLLSITGFYALFIRPLQLGVGAAVAVYSVYSASQNSKRAGRAQDAQTALGYEQLDMAKEQYQTYKDKILPLELEASQLGIDAMELAKQRGESDFKFYQDFYNPYREKDIGRQDARSEAADSIYGGLMDDVNSLEPQYDRVARDAANEVDNNFARQKGIDDRNLQRMGLRPDSGRYRGLDEARNMNQAATRSFAINNATENERDRVEGLKFNRKAQVGQMYMSAAGRNTPGLQTPSTPQGSFTRPTITGQGSASGVTGAMGSLATSYGNQAAQYRQQAGDDMYSGAYLYNKFKTPSNNGVRFGGGGGFDGTGYNASMNSAQVGSPAGDAMIDNAYQHGGLVEGPEGVDRVPATVDGANPARLSSGEYVIPEDVVEKLGTNHFDKLIEQYHEGPSPSHKSGLKDKRVH